MDITHLDSEAGHPFSQDGGNNSITPKLCRLPCYSSVLEDKLDLGDCAWIPTVMMGSTRAITPFPCGSDVATSGAQDMAVMLPGRACLSLANYMNGDSTMTQMYTTCSDPKEFVARV